MIKINLKIARSSPLMSSSSIEVSQQSSNKSDSQTTFMWAAASASFTIQKQNLSKRSELQIKHPDEHPQTQSFYLCPSACRNLWVGEISSGK